MIADAAYPHQSAAGIRTILADAGVAEVLADVLTAIRGNAHIHPTVFLDTELAALSPRHADGIEPIRRELTRTLEGVSVHHFLHDQIIALLDEAGRKFHVLVIKTNQRLPYTSVFIELECGYWSAEAETDLRAAMKSINA